MFKKFFHGDKINRIGYVFIAPFFLVLLMFNVYPMLKSFYLSFTSWDGGISSPKFIGLKNFVDLLHDSTFFQSIGNTFTMWIVSFIPQMVLALLLAAILADKFVKIRGKGFFRAVFYVPNLVTMATVGLLFYYILDTQSGSLNKVLLKLHILSKAYEWLQDPVFAKLSISFILFWMWFGYSMIIFMAGINAIPNELFEAGRVDGANKWSTFWHITLPSLKSSILYNIITSIIGGFTIFDVSYVLSGGLGAPLGSTLTTVNYMYNMTFKNWNAGYGAAIYTGLFVLIVIVVAVSFRIISNKFTRSEVN